MQLYRATKLPHAAAVCLASATSCSNNMVSNDSVEYILAISLVLVCSIKHKISVRRNVGTISQLVHSVCNSTLQGRSGAEAMFVYVIYNCNMWNSIH